MTIKKYFPGRKRKILGFQLMGVSICLVDRSLGKDAKMGHDLLLTITTQRSLPEICTASASTQEPELTRVGKIIISSEKKYVKCLDDTFPACKFYIESCWCSTNITLIALIILIGHLLCFRSFLHNMLHFKVGETAAQSQ